jgi:hypothetical protein
LEASAIIKNMSAKKKGQTPKVGDTERVRGGELEAMSVTPKEGGGHLVTYSPEPFDRKRGYRRYGADIEFFAPPFVDCGNRRDPSAMSEADWDLSPLLELPNDVKQLALWHELARESSRLRESFRLCADARSLPDDYRKRELYLDNPDRAEQERFHRIEEAQSFLQRLMKKLPRGHCFEDEWIAADTPWLKVDETWMKIYLREVAEVRSKAEKRPSSLKLKDVPVLGPTGVFGEMPLQVASEWRSKDYDDGRGNRPNFMLNTGMPDLPELTFKGNGKEADQILTESADICICYNYRDEDIVDAFKRWLKASRARLVDDLEPFRKSSQRPYTKMNNKDVEAAIKGLSALRLLAVMKPLEAAGKFLSIYFPKQRNRKVDIGNVQKAALIPVEWQKMFFPYCPLDSAIVENPEKGPWDLECPMCFRVIRKHSKEPKPISTHHYRETRCEWCDHRLPDQGWDGKTWVRHSLFEWDNGKKL